jgi:hypothetical protein
VFMRKVSGALIVTHWGLASGPRFFDDLFLMAGVAERMSDRMVGPCARD